MLQFQLRILITLLSISYCKLSIANHYLPTDSIGIVKKESKTYILHKVEPKETLYGLSKRYGVSVEEIREANPEIEQGLKIAQIIKVPLKNKESLIGKNVNETLISSTKGKKIHVVEQSQTLYSISRIYGVTVDDIKKWNNLTGNDIKMGQSLVVGINQESKTETTEKDTVQVTEENIPSDTSKQEEKTDKSYTKIGVYKKVIEKGLAELITDKDFDNTKYLALHRTAPAGTIMHVKNEKNGLGIFVRIIGTLSDDKVEKNVILKISKKAHERLSAEDNKFAVVISYIP